MPPGEVWRGRALTARTMALLCLARFLVACVPLRLWRGSLGLAPVPGDAPIPAGRLREAEQLASRIERAGLRLPLATKCLPRAIALSWMLRRRGIAHAVVIAARPPEHRTGEDDLHAWVEAGGTIILGDLPGPWHVLFRTHQSQSVR